ncbi:MAG: hypothetical protein ACI3Z5_06715 [Paludibacteraceae bacterium]
MKTMKTMQYIFSRGLSCRSCLLAVVLLLPVLAFGAVADNQSFTILQEYQSVTHALYSTTEHAQHANSAMPCRSSLRGQSMMSSSWQMVENKGVQWLVQPVSATQVRLSEIGSATPYTPSEASGESRRPFRVSDDNIGDPAPDPKPEPVGEVPFVLMLLLCGAWMWLRRRKTA